MAIFNSYVKLPEGKSSIYGDLNPHVWDGWPVTYHSQKYSIRITSWYPCGIPFVYYIYTHHDTPIILSKAIVNHPKFYIFYGRESNYQFTWVVYQSLLYKH